MKNGKMRVAVVNYLLFTLRSSLFFVILQAEPKQEVSMRCTLLSVFLAASLLATAVPIDSLRSAISRLDGKGKSEAYEQLYHALDKEGMVEPMLECLDEWVAYEEKEGNIENEARARWNKIVVMTNYVADSLLLEEAPIQMTWFMHHNEWEYYYDTWDSKANVYLYRDRIQTALHEARDILDDANSRQNNFGRAVAYQLMGIIYESIGQYEYAIEVFRQCLGQLKDSYRDSEVLTNAYDYLCQTLDQHGDYLEELKMAQEHEECVQDKMSRKESSREAYIGSYVACICNRASAYIGLKRTEEAAREIRRAEKLMEEQAPPLAKYRLLLVKSRLSLMRGNAAQAMAYCNELKRLKIHGGGDIGLLRADILTKMGRTAEAAKLYRGLYLHKDSMFTRDMRMQLDELNTLYQVEELEMKGKLQQSQFIIGICVLLFVCLLIYTISRYRASLKLEKEHQLLMTSNEKLELSYKKLKIANRQAEESLRMKTNFIQQISHEIRTPLNILSGFTQIVTTPNMTLDEDMKKDINAHITENTNRITNLVNKMLALSDVNSRTVIECNDDVPAVQIASQATDESHIAVNPNLQFSMQINPDVENLVLHTNAQEAIQALVMLLDNAQKFLHGKRSDKAKHGHVSLLLRTRGKMVDFVVEDDGIGIPKKDAERIFDEFVQLDEYYDGTGIGLTIARSSARRMKGDVILDTSYTQGARFILSLPAR